MSKKDNTIKGLVFDIIHQTNGKVDYETVTKIVLKYFPDSKWKRSHWSWYKNQIRNGRFKLEFSAKEKKNLILNKKPSNFNLLPIKAEKEEYHVKKIGDSILNHVRMMVKEISKNDEDFMFKLNRWVYSRLLQDEVRKKKPIKQELWSLGMRSCQKCDKEFTNIKGVEIHRKDNAKAYSLNNCELLCRACHQKG